MFILALFATLIERYTGYPQWLFAQIGHPVTWMGTLITWLEKQLNRQSDTFARRRLLGLFTLLVLLVATLLATFLAEVLLHLLLPWPLVILSLVFLASSLIAQNSLFRHVEAVADALETNGVVAGQEAVSLIVGRDTSVLDEAGVARAAIESLAENFSDGITAPVFWLAMLGVPGAAVYKAINTADSMIGHKNDRYRAFGWAAARLDDFVNLPASRITAFLFIAAAYMRGADWRGAYISMKRDAGRHRSPNAGWPESTMAGALGLSLAGPRHYAGTIVEDAFMNDSGRRDANAADIRAALRLARHASTLLIMLLVALAVVIG
ncbi:adenosylcobinamide-phosphate synthase CbiB [Limoniibacter endophyticus]|uniref:Cobalamin biosynthesis protein CobD n=1 Tax=Limoniibacter endophyticus TaxID=1565040 RepID=A0A8J3DJG9_9HYPH|nr:adenosylcobinamide-phosphate synthase CbiB [Limoniibacter endophyticus]GHC78404.1 cobalamin biosynthesis protein CobD [Limoniibacter endophyticus]